MEYIMILILTGLMVGGFLLLLDVITFGLYVLTGKCEDWKKSLKEKKNG